MTTPESPPIITLTPDASNRTVIIGAGIIGLSTAYHLSQQSPSSEIIVIDAATTAFAETSGKNTGALSFHWFESDMRKFGEYSYSIYESLAKDADFRTQCGFRDHAVFNVSQGQNVGYSQLPRWICPENNWEVVMEPEDGRAGSINPVALGEWLTKQCEAAAGITIFTSTSITDASLSSSGEIDTVELSQARQKCTIQCQNLVIAAGPWTPKLTKTLFPDTSVDMETDMESSDWILFSKRPGFVESDIGLVVFDDLVGHKLEFSGRCDGTIWMCGFIDSDDRLPQVGYEPDPDENHIQMLIMLATKYTTCRRIDIDKTGRTYRPTIYRDLPVIAAIPYERLVADATGVTDDVRTGVYICSGHGKYGITLGMGSGKAMAQLLLGQKLDIDLSGMGLPPVSKKGKR